MQKQIEGSRAVAEAVALCRPEVICAYPISPQTHIVEGLGEGDTVVIAGQQRIQKDGSALRIIDVNRARGEGAPASAASAPASARAPDPTAPLASMPASSPAAGASAPAMPPRLAAAPKTPEGPNPCLLDMGSGRAAEGAGRKGEARGASGRS